MAKMHIACAAMIAAAILAGCGETASSEAAAGASGVASGVALVVNGAKLTDEEIKKDVDAVIAAQGDGIPKDQLEYARRQIANQMAQTFIIENVLMKKAKDLGYEATEADIKEHEAELLESLAKAPGAPKTLEEAFAKSPLGTERTKAEFLAGVLIDKMLKGEVSAKNDKDYGPDADKIIGEIQAENEKNAGSLEAALEKINGFKATLDATPAEEKAAKFAELAKENSDCPSSAKGGDLGDFTRGMMVKEFEDVAFAQNVGEISAPVKTRFGYHLILTTEKTPATEAKEDAPATPEKVKASHILVKVAEPQEVPERERVIKFLKAQDERAAIGKFIKDELDKAEITASAEFAHLIPEKEAPAAATEENATNPVATPAE